MNDPPRTSTTTTSGPDSMLSRGLRLLLTLAGHPHGARLSTLAGQLDLPISTARRMLQQMLSLDFVSYDERHHTYTLGLSVFELSQRVSLVEALRRAAQPALRRVVSVTGEQALLGTRHRQDLVYLAIVDGPNQIQNHVDVGRRGPLHCTALGKALLAGLTDTALDKVLAQLNRHDRQAQGSATTRRLPAEIIATRKRGYAINDEEHELGVRAVAVAIPPIPGYPATAICVTAPVFRLSRNDLDRCVPLLAESAQQIHHQLHRDIASEATPGSPRNGPDIPTA